MHIFVLNIVLLVFSNSFTFYRIEASLESYVSISSLGNTFTPKSITETPLATLSTSSLLICGIQCNQNQLCRTFVYEKSSSICQLYQSDSQSGNITTTNAITSVVGQIQYIPELFVNYNRTCDQCQINRYLTCRNDRCQCPSTTTYWNGQMCRNQHYYGESCSQSNWCRNDLNLTCVFSSCQSPDASQ